MEAAGENPDSFIGAYLNGMEDVIMRERTSAGRMFDKGKITLKTKPLHTVHALDLQVH
ncbi:MAG: hypothetical protein NC306_12585 [Butyrivibrio sp.]|nr:hypothetical protein [Butyrivibrio sp.]